MKKTIRELMMRIDSDEHRRIMSMLVSGDVIGEEITLRITDYRNRFDLGTFKAKITKWEIPVPHKVNNKE